jgi:hypothetical protein
VHLFCFEQRRDGKAKTFRKRRAEFRRKAHLIRNSASNTAQNEDDCNGLGKGKD